MLGDDIQEGHTTDFRMAVKAEADEEVLYDWIEWPDKATRDTAFAKMTEWMNDPEKADPHGPGEVRCLSTASASFLVALHP